MLNTCIEFVFSASVFGSIAFGDFIAAFNPGSNSDAAAPMKHVNVKSESENSCSFPEHSPGRESLANSFVLPPVDARSAASSSLIDRFSIFSCRTCCDVKLNWFAMFAMASSIALARMLILNLTSLRYHVTRTRCTLAVHAQQARLWDSSRLRRNADRPPHRNLPVSCPTQSRKQATRILPCSYARRDNPSR